MQAAVWLCRPLAHCPAVSSNSKPQAPDEPVVALAAVLAVERQAFDLAQAAMPSWLYS